jgi:hypothetical protein
MDLSYIPARASYDWRRIAARARDDWYVGLDIGQSIDPSAVAVINHTVEPLESWQPNANAESWRQDRNERFFVRHLERLPLGMPYPQQVQHIQNLLSRKPLRGAQFALDYTGCGRPVADLFYAAGLRPQNILITAGNEVSQHRGDTFHVPKQLLISAMEARLHTGELKIAAALADAPALRDELKDFARKVSDAGRVTYSARAGAHDDLVLAVAIALFAACNRNTASWEELKL